MVVKLWSQLEWTGRRSASEPLAASDMLAVMRLYGAELPEVWEFLLMVETRIFSHRQGMIEKKKKQESKRKNG